jgi:hypothetical protein
MGKWGEKKRLIRCSHPFAFHITFKKVLFESFYFHWND